MAVSLLPKGAGAPRSVRSTIAGSQLTSFITYCEAELGRSFADYRAFDAFAISDYRRFWRLFLTWSKLPVHGAPEPVCTSDLCEQATFFPNLRVNYAEALLHDRAGDERVAVTACHASGGRDRLTRRELRDRVQNVAAGLQALGVTSGTRVAAIAHNNADTIVAALAVAAVGGCFSAASPDMGSMSILGRFGPLSPAVLMAHFGDPAGAEAPGLADRVAEVAGRLPSVRQVVALDDGPVPSSIQQPVRHLSQMATNGRGSYEDGWTRVPFNHPLFVLFSSGTTGQPKCIVHGAGGTLLEHLKEHTLHGNLRPNDKLFFHTSTAWMMWNWQLSALAVGSEIVVYDGPVAGSDTLWRIVADEQVTVFGTSPPYLRHCQDENYSPRAAFRLPALRTIQSTGSILYDQQYEWVREHVGPVPVQSISGGTDIIGCFVLGNPNLPVRAGTSQCRSLGLDVVAYTPDGREAAAGVIGELVCRNPFPSRPVGLLNDAAGTGFHDAYFSQNPGVWTHGDLIEFGADGGARLHGRSDGILNVNGVRIGQAEIYRILQDIPEIRESMAVEQRIAGESGRSQIVLLVIPATAGTITAAVESRIRRELAEKGSAAHVPALIVEVPALPSTHSGKRSERAAHDALNGLPVKNVQALKNGECLDEIRAAVERARVSRLAPGLAAPTTRTETALAEIWQTTLGISQVGTRDNFFDLGGNSLQAARLCAQIKVRLGVALPISALLASPTIGELAAVLNDAPSLASPLVAIRANGSRRPFYFVHPVGGEVLCYVQLAQRLSGDVPVYGLRALVADGEEQPTTIEGFAEQYLATITSHQPTGPYRLGGYSLGGVIAYEMARRLLERGERVSVLAMIDSAPPMPGHLPPFSRLLFNAVRRLPWWLRERRYEQKARYWAWAIRRLFITGRIEPEAQPDQVFSQWFPGAYAAVARRLSLALARYEARPCPAHVTLFRAAAVPVMFTEEPEAMWGRLAQGGVDTYRLRCSHHDFLTSGELDIVARELDSCLSAAA